MTCCRRAVSGTPGWGGGRCPCQQYRPDASPNPSPNRRYGPNSRPGGRGGGCPPPDPPPRPTTEWPQAPPRAPVSRTPGDIGTSDPKRGSRHCARLQRAIKFGWRAFRPEWPPGPGKSTFRPVSGPRKLSKSPTPPKTGESRSAAAGCHTVETAKFTKRLRGWIAVPMSPHWPEKWSGGIWMGHYRTWVVCCLCRACVPYCNVWGLLKERW